jgi:excisionase family DNA binding protein
VQVSPSAVLRWIDQGLLPAYRTPGGHRRVGAGELVEFLKAQHMPVPRSLEARQVRMLVIDDEPRFLTSLKEVLRRADPRLEVEVAEGAIDGLLKVGSRRPDVVLLDTYMPGMDGLEVCRRIKATPETAHVAVMAMSGRRSDELARRYEEAGAACFLQKPLDPQLILTRIRELGLLEAAVPRRQ